MNCLQRCARRASIMLAALAVILCAGLPASAQVPSGLLRFGTSGVYAPQLGDCLSILAMNSSGQTATDSSVPCSPAYLAAAYTNATTAYTAVMSLPTLQGGVVAHGECTLTWADNNTTGTATFAAQLSAAPTDLWVTAVPTDGVFVAPTYTAITTTTQTAVTGALVTTTANANYRVRLSFVLSTTATAPSTLTIYAESNSASYTVTVQPGSSCEWVP